MALLYVANNGFSCHLTCNEKKILPCIGDVTILAPFNVRVQLSSFCFSSHFFNNLAGLQVRDFWGVIVGPQMLPDQMCDVRSWCMCVCGADAFQL